MSTLVAAHVPETRASSGFRFAMLLPGALVTFLLILFALGLVLFLAFRGNDGSLLGAGFSLANFITVVSDPLYWTVTLRSLIIAALVTLATVVTAYPVAYYLAFHAGRRRGLLLFLVTLPFWTSYLLRVFAWKIVLAYNGVLNSALIESGIWSEPTLTFLNTPAAVVVTLAHAYAPFAILPIYVALDTIPKSLIEAASDLGARPFTSFRRVVLPNSMPGVLAAALVVFVPTVGDYVTPAMVGGPASTMIGSLIQSQFGKANDWPFGAALSVCVMLVILLVVLVARGADRRFGSRT
ncbi:MULTISPECIES: ABC transporter permease [unclassified Mesorhizobium]|uniref:ABC transporter permease n=1 Tax=unclassified Mesorhizobium TaxID=325217 RepID=UPI000FD618D8|nr:MULTISPECIES: ABC transporter permease [unclassified Mesorhizobium]RUX06380.1 ABC transporter permease [Mesorhizobium sp. M8A.F.Ca.ET.023.01.1.1]RUX08441.1 ABC transporter permease [Mesorhizobium sp. M8A.F.Ca.ET.059.01.1.1]TGU94112.1 ABC transporter permease [Mesorhizobium sp. M00.F.Ca.ET.151.01.1.1]TGV13852.1 ABC transporter permease [Mesorhizobium sp. M8A.F.Ca.ET.173.01.1.1]TGV56690.1 ABC transporter permease [bacterium M00.F.Ca.ET.141.01.1.1]